MILMYHAVADVPEDPNYLSVAPQRFAEQMAWMAARGLRGVSIAALVDAMRQGKTRGMVGITFDDGYTSVIESALPVLKKHGFGATVFIISGLLGGTNEWDEGPSWPLMSGDQVNELAAAGIEIGSHSATHMRLAGASEEQLRDETADSRTALTKLCGTDIGGFAYPYGSMDASARAAVREAGYDYACAVQTPGSELGLMALPRVYIGQSDSAARLAVKRALYLPYVAIKGRNA